MESQAEEKIMKRKAAGRHLRVPTDIRTKKNCDSICTGKENENLKNSRSSGISYLNKFDIEVEARRIQMRKEGEILALAIDQNTRLWKLQLPHKVRSMTIGELSRLYGGDVSRALVADTKKNILSLTTPITHRKLHKDLISTARIYRTRKDMSTPSTITRVQPSAI